MAFRSPSCASRSTGKPLMAYLSEVEAQSQARHSKEVHNTDLSSYQCRRCKLWHMRPASPPHRVVKCFFCKGRDGQYKTSYASEAEAQRQADRLSNGSYLQLRPHECFHSGDWHLTSKI